MTKPCAVASISLLSLLATASCTSTSAQPGDGAAAGAAGSTTGVGGAGGAAMIGGPSGLPVPPGPGGVPQPTGTPGNLHVLDWAGFKSAVTYTFDDAQPSQIEHYAELQATGAHFTFYITSGNSGAIGGFDATFTQAVTDGHEMGNHTVHHCHANLSGCSTGSATSLDTELDDCNSYISTHFGAGAGLDGGQPVRRHRLRHPRPDALLPEPRRRQRHWSRRSTTPTRSTCPATRRSPARPSTASTPRSTAAHTAGPLADLPGSHDHADDRRTGTRRSTSPWSPAASRTRRSLGDVWIDTDGQRRRVLARAEAAVATATPATASGAQTWTWTLPANFPPGKFVRVTVDGGTLSQNGTTVPWDGHGYYEIALDAGSLTVSP